MDFVEDNRPSGWELATQDPFTMFRNVPVEIILFSGDDSACQCGFPDLPRPSDKDHFMSQISLHLVGQVTCFHAGIILLFYTVVKITREFIYLLSKKETVSLLSFKTDKPDAEPEEGLEINCSLVYLYYLITDR